MYYHDFKGNKISSLGFGVMRLPTEPGNPDKFIWSEGQKIIDRAIELGVNYFDTAHIYLKTDSERFLGETLKKYPGTAITWPPSSTAAGSGTFVRHSLLSWSGCRPTMWTFICCILWTRKLLNCTQIRN